MAIEQEEQAKCHLKQDNLIMVMMLIRTIFLKVRLIIIILEVVLFHTQVGQVI